MLAAPPKSKSSPLIRPVTELRGVGPERARQLERLGIRTLEDLLLHRPRRYEDRRHFRPIRQLELNEPALTRGTIVALGVKRFRKGTRSVFEFILEDGTARLHCRWWNLPFMENYFKTGDEVVVFGKPILLKPRTMDHPETEVVEPGEEHFVHFNRITPVYPLTEGLPQRWLRGLVWRALEQFVAGPREHTGNFPEWNSADEKLAALPGATAAAFPSRANAVHMLHFPETLDDVEIARRRLALDEFIALQERIQARRRVFESKSQALPCGGDNRLMKPFLATLKFKLTDAQTRVLREIRADLRGRHPMRRLLQGDVGSGKTVVAACAALMTLESGYSVALMAPTEILAEQHHRNFSQWLQPLGIAVELQTGARKTTEEKRRGAGDAQPHAPDLVTRHPSPVTLTIGTHALLTADFEIPRLGLVVIDEQHKFGVAQREELVRKGRYPHLLIMTATPIPRTLGLTLYGELDVSTIDELPAGRGRVRTVVRDADTLPKIWPFIREQLASGRQAYVVYPRVDETGANGTKAVTREFAQVQRAVSPYRAGLLHGRLPAREKEEVMKAFRANVLQLLLATSLIEVGVDVPNATVMLIENAEQFGLAQLHQLRGRIGRGAHESWCILVAGGDAEAKARLDVLAETNDGFRIAEADLKLRGPGDLLGWSQSGAPDFRFGDLVNDWELIRLAQASVRRTP
jgi:ATP-dependent DNA helicase RecG